MVNYFIMSLNGIITACIVFKRLCSSFKQLCVYIENIHLNFIIWVHILIYSSPVLWCDGAERVRLHAARWTVVKSSRIIFVVVRCLDDKNERGLAGSFLFS